METAVIVPKFINEMKQGVRGPYFTIKDTGDTTWCVPAEFQHVFAKGKQTPVQYERSEGNGRTYYWVRSADAPQAAPQAPQQAGAYAPAVPAQQPPASPAAPSRAVTQDEQIFVTGVVGRSMQSGNFSVDEIHALTAAAVQAFRNWQA